MTTVSVPVPAKTVTVPAVTPPPLQVSITSPGEASVSGSLSVPEVTPPPVLVPAYTVPYAIQTADAVATLQAEGYTVTPPSTSPVNPPPPVNPSPPASGADLVLSNGQLNKASYWVGDFSYDLGSETYGATAPDGSTALKIVANSNGSPPGGGGWQPYYQTPGAAQAGGFTPLAFLNVTMWATRPQQEWLYGVQGTGDQVIPGASPPAAGTQFNATAIGSWQTYKLPVSVPAGATIEKFRIQDQLPWVNSSESAGNTWYVKDAWWSAT